MDSTPQANVHREAILARVDELGLDRHASDLDRLGYSIVEDVASPRFIDALRHECVAALDGGNGERAAMLLSRGGIFDDAVCLPKVLALAEYMVGKGCLLSQVSTQRKRQQLRTNGSSNGTSYGSKNGSSHGSSAGWGNGWGNGISRAQSCVHSDLVGIAEPFGPHPWLMTAVFALDDWREGAGEDTLVPRSHKLERHPVPGAGGHDLMPVRMRKGSVVVWNGAIHHGETPRIIPGDRVSLHLTYSRLVLRTWEDYSDVVRELRQTGRGDSTLASLLGANDPFGKNDEHGPRRDKLRTVHEWFRT